MIDWSTRTALVTGASGFIGGALVRALMDAGARVVAVIGTSRRLGEASFTNHVECGDICDPLFVREAISRHGVTDIFHLAAYSIVADAAKDPAGCYRVNVQGTVNVLEAARNLGGIKSILVASSDKAYGDQPIPYRESAPLLAANTYDASKACADMIARSFAANYDMPVCVTRASNVYGPGDPNLSRIVPNTIRRVLAGLPPMIYSDLTEMRREFVYIDDVVSALLELGGAGEVGAWNIGLNDPVSITHMLELIAAACGRDDMRKRVEVVERAPNFREIKVQAIDAQKLRVCTDWSPKVSLVEGIARTVESYRRAA